MLQVSLTPVEILHEVEIAVILTIGGWVLMFPIKSFFKTAKGLVTAFDKRIAEMQEELVQQRTNCLATLQSQGKEQITVLTKMSDTLDKMHISQAEMSGYFKGSHKE